jgi:hypothetical protein
MDAEAALRNLPQWPGVGVSSYQAVQTVPAVAGNSSPDIDARTDLTVYGLLPSGVRLTWKRQPDISMPPKIQTRPDKVVNLLVAIGQLLPDPPYPSDVEQRVDVRLQLIAHGGRSGRACDGG